VSAKEASRLYGKGPHRCDRSNKASKRKRTLSVADQGDIFDNIDEDIVNIDEDIVNHDIQKTAPHTIDKDDEERESVGVIWCMILFVVFAQMLLLWYFSL
jgi:hypothetical protein